MCEHRASDRWSRFWGWAVVVWTVSFAVPEAVGLIRVGPEATLSHFLQRRAGVLEPCSHTPLGRFVVVTVGLWLIAHLGWGLAGWAPPPLRRCQTATRHLTTTESACT